MFVNTKLNYLNIINKILANVIDKYANKRPSLVGFCKFLLVIGGVCLAIYLYTFIHELCQQISSSWQISYLQSEQLSHVQPFISNIEGFEYWTSTLYLLVQSKKYNVFLN